MKKRDILKRARSEEFWVKETQEYSQFNESSFFAGTNLKTEDGITEVIVPLRTKSSIKVAKLCSHSEILQYNFYSCILSIVMSKYQEVPFFLSLTDQIQALSEKEKFFFINPKIDEKQDFKSIFSIQKKTITKQIEHALSLEEIKSISEENGYFNYLTQLSLIIGDSEHESLDHFKTVFRISLDEKSPSLTIKTKGTYYEPELLRFFGESFACTLNEVLVKTYEPIHMLNFRGNSESKTLTLANEKRDYFPLEKNIIELIEYQSLNNFDKCAVKHREDTITYGDLSMKTNQLAHYLIDKHQVKNDDLFGVMMSRSIPMIKAIVSVWKSGSAYVPIGINLPDENLVQIIENSKFKAIITDNDSVISQLSRLPIEVLVIRIDKEESDFASYASTLPKVTINPNDLAYVIYTSGSTGKPKGVMIEHLGMLNHMGAKIIEIGIEKDSIVAQNAPHTFDISIWQFFTPLAMGGTCIIYDDEAITDIQKFVSELKKDQITILELVPSYLLETLYHIENEKEKVQLALAILILNAETLTKPMVGRWLSLYPEIPIVNTYGATEVSDDTSHYIINQVPDSYSVPVMKHPIQNFEVHIVDSNLQRVPLGVNGEILLAGPCVGRGYFNDKKRTQESFLKGPLDGITDYKRIYKTGDIGRRLPNGTMEFIGRNDNQVKIRGHRIELDAIENCVAGIATIKNVKAVANIEKQFIALYYTADIAIAKENIESVVLQKLPSYMLPSAIIHIDNFPLTTNGKINKKALPNPEKFMVQGVSDYVAPETDIQQKIAMLWQEILGIKKIGLKDNFFDLGGHSLKLMRLKNEYHKIFEVNIKIKDFFEHKTLESHAALIANTDVKVYESIEKLEEKESYLMSDAQRRLWVLSQLEKDSATYNMPSSVVLSGAYNLDNFKKALDAVIERHEILRTVFKGDESGEIKQYVLNTSEYNFELHYQDYREDSNKENKAKKLIKEDSILPFDLEYGPLFRATLFQFDDEHFLFYYNIHHIIGDGWSTEVLARDVMAYYDSYTSNQSVDIPELNIQYKDYASWQLSQLSSAPYKKHKAYWLSQLDGSLPVLDLPTNRTRPLVKTDKGKRLKTYLSQSDSLLIKDFSIKKGGTLFMGLLTVWNALLSRYSGAKDLIIGSPIVGREHSDLKEQIGFYVNTLPFRNSIEASDTFESLFDRVKNSSLEAYSHQMYPFDRLVEDLDSVRDMSRNALFDVMFTLQNNGENQTHELSKNAIDLIVDQGSIPAKFDLNITMEEVGNYLSLSVTYNSDIYTHDMIEGLIVHFKMYLSELVNTPNALLSKVNYLSEVELTKVLEEFNNTEVSYPKGKTILDFFGEQVLKYPERTAIVFEDIRISYLELDKKSNHFAHYLKDTYNIEKEDLIGIKLERSEWMIISILGILKTGGAYVPIDPDFPEDRIAYIEEDTKFKVCVDEEELVKFNSSIYLDTALNIQINPNNLSYVIYTSGSTGMPKGVMVEHEGLLNRFLWMGEELNVTQEDVFLQKTPFTFDVSVWELLLPLIYGSKLVFAIPGGHKTPDYLEQIILQESITILHFVPSMLGIALETIKWDKLDSLRHVVCSGEELPKHLEYLFKEKSLVSLHNYYGPTEASIDVTKINLSVFPTQCTAVSIGKPAANTSIYIVNDSLLPQPIGVLGEILIGGNQVARGYLNRETLTKEKFIINPFKARERLYKTGDLGRWLPDGNIEFIGRKDNQVKIRGHRIELGEIENKLLSYESIQEAVVLIEGEEENKQITAFFVSNIEFSNNDLRSFLLQKIPNYMIPSKFVKIKAIPVTTNGKIDKKGLLATHHSSIQTGIAYLAPQNEIQSQLLLLWSKTLKKESSEIGIDVGFFEIGGNSLLLIKLREEIQKTFNKEVSITSLFQNVTIEMQALMVSNEGFDSEPNLVVEQLERDSLKFSKVAVIGMSLKIPGASSLDEFWESLIEGKELIQKFSEEELRESGVPEAHIKDEKYVPYGSYLEGKENFDAAFFGYLPDEAKQMDPQTRIFHEIVWSALENSGYDPRVYKGLIGLYAGAKSNIKWQAYSILNNNGKVDAFTASQLNDKDFLNSLIAYKLNLKGPVHTVNTACSTSLVAVHQAVQSIINGENHMAVAGGISIKSSNKEGYFYKEGMISSSDGHNKAFDADSSGTVSGEGAGAIVLKRLDKAILDGDNIIAVIKGSAINNDGNRKVGYTAPSIEGQVEVIKAAHRVANVEPKTIQYIEAHGTATKLGDHIEVKALNTVFGASKEKYIGLGTVKSNVGHLDSAAGILGFIKTAMCLKNKKLVPSLHYRSPNPEINFKDSPLYVTKTYQDWIAKEDVLRAGVSSFGIGGTNAHVILEEPPVLEQKASDKRKHMVVLSAMNNDALERQQSNLLKFLKNKEDIDFSKLAWTLQKRKARFLNRVAFIADSNTQAIDIFENRRALMNKGTTTKEENPIVFMFPGQGSQYVNMGKDLYENETVFKTILDECFEIALQINQFDYKKILFPEETGDKALLNKTEYTQPILFMFEYALTKQLAHYGVKPNLMIGHSIGEYVAACVSGVLSLKDAIRVVIKRGQLIQELPGGDMLSIASDLDIIQQNLPKSLQLAAINTKNNCVVSGPENAIKTFSEWLDTEEISYRKLRTSHAFHSTMMDPVVEPFKKFMKEIEINRPIIPYISNVSARAVSSEELNMEAYWSNHILNTVKFSESIEHIIKKGNPIFIEVGPGKTLSNFVKQHHQKPNTCKVSNLVKHPKEQVEDDTYFLSSLSKLWTYGIELDWEKLHNISHNSIVSLPTYPFEKIAFPLGVDVFKQLQESLILPNNNFRNEKDKWFYEPIWQEGRLKEIYQNSNKKTFIVFRNENQLSKLLIKKIKNEGSNVIEVLSASSYERVSGNKYKIDISIPNDYERLRNDIEKEHSFTHLVNIFNVDKTKTSFTNSEYKENAFYSLLYTAKYFGTKNKITIPFLVISNDQHQLTGLEPVQSLKSMTLGLLNVITQEYPLLDTKNIDISLTEKPISYIGNLYNELVAKIENRNVIYRFNKRWIKTYKQIEISEFPEADKISKIKNEGVYLITGGLGNLGYVYANFLQKEYNAKLILIGRSEIDQDNLDKNAKTRRLQNLKEKGEVLYYNVDMSDTDTFKKTVRQAESDFGTINGIIHAAGIVSGKSIRGINFLTPKACEEQFNPKVQATLSIREIFGNSSLDFCVLISSLSTVLGGKEFGAYAASNAFLDSIANIAEIPNCISINLDGLDFESQRNEFSLNPEEMVLVFKQALSIENTTQLVVSLSDLIHRIDKWTLQTSEDLQGEQEEEEKYVLDLNRENLSTLYIAPVTSIEKELLQIFEDYFGMKGIGIEDNFFDLGGDSLKAMTLLNHIHKKFLIVLSIKDFFENQTIKTFSKEIELRKNMETLEHETTNVKSNIEILI